MNDTPWKDNGYTDKEKKDLIEFHFNAIMKALGMDLNDDSLIDTPKRVAKMYVDEYFYGLLPDNFPKITVIENKFNYNEMLTELNIILNSCCEHHFVPIIGKAHVSYIPDKKVIGLSKLNRIVDYYARRPQVQERLTLQIRDKLIELLDTKNVAVVIDAVHLCVKTRGIKDGSSITRTSSLSGQYFDSISTREEFFKSIPSVGSFVL